MTCAFLCVCVSASTVHLRSSSCRTFKATTQSKLIAVVFVVGMKDDMPRRPEDKAAGATRRIAGIILFGWIDDKIGLKLVLL